MPAGKLRICPKGHKYYKSSDCPVCPVCEKERKPNADFLSLVSAPARRALEREGIDSLLKLSRYTEEKLLTLHGMGPGSLPKLRKVLKGKNYHSKKVANVFNSQNKTIIYFCSMSFSLDTSRIVLQPVTVTFLEMHESKAFPVLLPDTQFEVLPKPIDVNEYRKYYYGVGEKYFWLDRMVMPDEELFEKINADNIEIFLFYVNKEVAGYIEFVKEEKYVEILYFGLMPTFIGKGFGKYFLEWVIAKAWSYQPEWIQLNTCTLDHPNALDTYKKAGFVQVRTETHQRRVLI